MSLIRTYTTGPEKLDMVLDISKFAIIFIEHDDKDRYSVVFSNGGIIPQRVKYRTRHEAVNEVNEIRRLKLLWEQRMGIIADRLMDGFGSVNVNPDDISVGPTVPPTPIGRASA